MYQKCFVLIHCHEVWFSSVIPQRISLFALHVENIARAVHFSKSKHKGLDKAFNRTEGKNNLCRGYQIKTDIKCKHLLVQTKARKFSWEGERPSLDSFRNYIGIAERRTLPAIPTAFVIQLQFLDLDIGELMAGCFHWHALGWGFPIPVQPQCVNSEGSRGAPVTWSAGERGDGRNHLFAELSLFISSFLTNLHGRTLWPARLKLQSTLHWSVMGFLQTLGRSSALTLGLVFIAAASTCMWVTAPWRGFGALGQMMEVDPRPLPWLQAWFSQHSLPQNVGQL